MECTLYNDPYFKNINNRVASTNLFQEKFAIFAWFFNNDNNSNNNFIFVHIDQPRTR